MKPLPRVVPANTFPQSETGNYFLEKYRVLCWSISVLQIHLIVITGSLLGNKNKSIAKDELMFIPPCIAVKS